MKWRAVGFLAAVVVFAAGYVYWTDDRYRSRPIGGSDPTPVLVAKEPIPKGMSGWIVAYQSMYARTTLPPKEVEADAISEPRYLVDRVAVVDISPGEQLTETNLTASDASASP